MEELIKRVQYQIDNDLPIETIDVQALLGYVQIAKSFIDQYNDAGKQIAEEANKFEITKSANKAKQNLLKAVAKRVL